MAKIVVLIGTRPELVKLAPVVLEMQSRGLRKHLYVVNTGQHRETMQNTFAYLGIEPDATLDVMVPGQSLNELLARALSGLQKMLAALPDGPPAMILAQGDTATTCAGAITAFQNRIPFAHVEAGLRTGDHENPFPEEYYRRIISLAAQVHFTPTKAATANLLREGIPADHIMESGNTVVDALKLLQRISLYNEASNLPPAVRQLIRKNSGSLVLVTCHRRENFGGNLKKIISTVLELAIKHPRLRFVWVRHPNPAVKEVVGKSGLGQLDNVLVIPPLDYFDMIQLYPHVKLIITDSGGIQEEAPSFKVPVLVLRKTTERMESVKLGYAILCDADPRKITSGFLQWLRQPPRIRKNPYGDGRAARRICDHLQSVLHLPLKKNRSTHAQRKKAGV